MVFYCYLIYSKFELFFILKFTQFMHFFVFLSRSSRTFSAFRGRKSAFTPEPPA